MLKIDIFKKGIGCLTTAFPNHPINAEFYYQMLSDLDPDLFIKAVLSVCNEQKEIYPGTNLIAIIREKSNGDNNLLAGEAYGVLMAEISRTGSYGIPKFSDPVLSKTVESMGWKSLCCSNVDEANITRAQFIKIYNSILNRKNSENLNKNIPALMNDLIKQIAEKK